MEKAHFKIIMISFLTILRNKIISENNYEYTAISSLRENKVIYQILSKIKIWTQTGLCQSPCLYIENCGDLYFWLNFSFICIILL